MLCVLNTGKARIISQLPPAQDQAVRACFNAMINQAFQRPKPCCNVETSEPASMCKGYRQQREIQVSSLMDCIYSYEALLANIRRLVLLEALLRWTPSWSGSPSRVNSLHKRNQEPEATATCSPEALLIHQCRITSRILKHSIPPVILSLVILVYVHSRASCTASTR